MIIEITREVGDVRESVRVKDENLSTWAEKMDLIEKVMSVPRKIEAGS